MSDLTMSIMPTNDSEPSITVGILLMRQLLTSMGKEVQSMLLLPSTSTLEEPLETSLIGLYNALHRVKHITKHLLSRSGCSATVMQVLTELEVQK
jgi:hypothetical protein